MTDVLTSVVELLTAINKTPSDEMSKGHEIAAPLLPQMRTLPQAINELKKADPGTAVTLSALRRAVKQGRLPCVTVESKKLVDMSAVYAYLNGSHTEVAQIPDNNKIRKIGG